MIPKTVSSIQKTAISLFSGAGGMDIGFSRAGFDVLWANDYHQDACLTYAENLGNHIVHGDINALLPSLKRFEGLDCVFGGPPCQGFSVAGYMDPNDERSKLVMSFMDVIEITRPSVFIMENVKSLGTLKKFAKVRAELVRRADALDYHSEFLILNSKDFSVPQSRERVFFIGLQHKNFTGLFADYISAFHKPSKSVRETIMPLGNAGSSRNLKTVKAKITLAQRPILRKSPYAGMLFNGQGRPVNPNGYSNTLPASMGGNRTPIIDERQLYDCEPAWVEGYHAHLMRGGQPYHKDAAPSFLRRMTVDEAHLLQTFPESFQFVGRQSSVFKQIGNAVPCNLAEAVGNLAKSALEGTLTSVAYQPPAQTRMIFH